MNSLESVLNINSSGDNFKVPTLNLGDHSAEDSLQLIADNADAIKEETYRYGLVLLRGVAKCDIETFVDTGRSFGDVESIKDINLEVDAPAGDPRWYIESVERNGDDTDIPTTQRAVHQDRSYTNRPSDLSILRVTTPAEIGGNTNFVDMRAVYNFMNEPGDIRDVIAPHSLEDLQIAHSHSDTLAEYLDSPTPNESVLPLVAVHPVTGEKAIYHSEANVLRIYGVPRRVGAQVSQRIVDLSSGVFSTRGSLVPRYSHAWESTDDRCDMIVWDNRIVGHASTAIAP